MKHCTVIRFLEDTDAYRRADRFEQFLQACVIDATGRKGLADSEYPQADRLRRAQQATCQVDIKALQARGIKGAELAPAIHQQRVELLKRSGI